MNIGAVPVFIGGFLGLSGVFWGCFWGVSTNFWDRELTFGVVSGHWGVSVCLRGYLGGILGGLSVSFGGLLGLFALFGVIRGFSGPVWCIWGFGDLFGVILGVFRVYLWGFWWF